ncbi:MAG: NADH-quinone oxidoreductase subunit D [Actinomycetaceae bacterium]|nr:NADH-quinone oxidoreductase subunit D [Actinomycetaceae bacterium]
MSPVSSMNGEKMNQSATDSAPFQATAGASAFDPEAKEYFVNDAGDWETISAEVDSMTHDRIAVNMGPVHPSTHGVLRVVLELDGETVKDMRLGTGYLHTGIEKNMEYRNYTQGVAYCTRMDYLAPFFTEVAYCLAVEKLLGITDKIPQRATLIRVLLMELNRIGSHLVAIGTGANEMGATTMLTIGFRGREEILRIFEHVSGLRMNHEYIRPGGLAQDIPADTIQMIREKLPIIKHDAEEMQALVMANPIFVKRMKDVGYISLSAGLALGLTGPCLRAAGYPLDMRKMQPYCGYETYDFDVPTYDHSDCYTRTAIRFDEMYESLKIIYQVLDRLEGTEGQPVMVDDPHIAWPAKMSLGSDGQGQSPEHVAEIMGSSMEALIHHFKMVTEGFRVPAGQVFQMIEHAKGVQGVHLVADGGTRPYRSHFRDPSYSNLQSASIICEGGLIADVVVALGSLDPVLGGVDR